MTEITLQSIISAKKEIVVADMDGDTVMMKRVSCVKGRMTVPLTFRW